jgi:hypothetical protein
MSCREIEGGEPLESGNVVRLRPAVGVGVRTIAPSGQDAAAQGARAFQPEAITRDGLELLKAFFAIEDPAARAALLAMAQRFAELSSKT